MKSNDIKLEYEICDIDSVECIGMFEDEYVYDIEMEDAPHTFFANDILVHNSAYFNAQPFVDKVIGPTGKLTDKNIKHICKDIDNFVNKHINAECFNIVKKDLHSTIDSIGFKREAFASIGAFLAKKRYILYLRECEGIATDKFKYVGVEIKKTEIPLTVRNMLAYLVETSFKEVWNEAKYTEELRKLWIQYQKLSPIEVAYFKGLNKEKSFEGFMTPERGAQVHARAAIYYNQLIKELKISYKYESLRQGDRLRYLWLKANNDYNLDAIGFKDVYPKEFESIFIIDYEKMFKKMIMVPMMPVWAAMKMSVSDVCNEIEQSVLDL